MGRRWKRNRKNKQGDGKSREEKKATDSSKYGQERDPYTLIDGGNFKMEAYYAYQGVHDYYLDSETGEFPECTSNEDKEQERQRWLTSLKSILPASFRIGTDVDVGLRERLERELDEYVGKKMEIEFQPKGGQRRIQELNLKPEKRMVAPAKKIPYVPFGYQLSLDRQTIRRNTNLNDFHEWLKIQTQAGFITRQETVSMIPPVVLNPERHHKVLDMCAAPGSKTSQLLETVNFPAKDGDTEPSGLVVANDSDAKRAYMLVHQMRRINSPAVFITSADAQFFPLLKSESHPTEGLFDRVLCDVPCSGDATTRKNVGIWKRWNQLNAIGLHALQLAIALKGARLTDVGGYMCYSTCSMNPMENESVVAELLRASEGCLELVDRRSELPGLIARPGMSTWKVLSEGKSKKQRKDFMKKNNEKMQARRKEWEEKNKAEGDAKADTADTASSDAMPEAASSDAPSKEANSEMEEKPVESQGEIRRVHTEFKPSSMDPEALKEMVTSAGLMEYATFDDVPDNMKRKIRKSCFPPTPEENARFHLERCMRVMPQDMDTGGFFVALLKKVAPMNARARECFEKLQEELGETGANSEPDPEPKLKRAKVEPESESADAMEEDEQKPSSDEGNKASDDVLTSEKDSSAVVRGHVKKHYLEGSDGKKHESLGRDDFIPIPSSTFEPLKKFYGLSAESFDEGNYMVRACSDAKVMYFITKSVRALIDNGVQEKLTVVTSGLKGFVRNNKECEVAYRVAQDGVHFVAPHMTKRKVYADIEDFRKCLEPGTIKISGFSDSFAEEVRALSLGSFVVCLKGYENDYIKKLVLVTWRCRSDSLNTLVTQAELDGMKSKLRSIAGEDEPSSKTAPSQEDKS